MSHVNISKQTPAAYAQLVALSAASGEAAREAGLAQGLVELLRLRVSQINGCAFCCRLHARDAAAAGESADRLAVLAAWRESQYFSPVEESALALAEEVNALNVPPRTDWDTGELTADQVSAVTWLALVMGAWNRVAIRSGYPVAP